MKNYGHKLGVITAMALVATLLERKLTKEFLESEVDKVEYNRFSGTNTHCTITTKSGFLFTGESACVDPDNFDQEIGEKFAYENAFNKMWTPYGFWLHKALAEQSKSEDLLAVSAVNPTVDSQEQHQEPTMDFGYAVKMMKDGKRVSRISWNGKGMFLFVVKGATVTEAIEDCYGDPAKKGVHTALDAIYMHTVQGNLVPWLASQADVLAEDWQIV